ncbi:hypothetical protein DIPPA_32963 [Diplonema papillatum]|nr:hypothetical protein DIPPA_32963 [Diplonema papillatum]
MSKLCRAFRSAPFIQARAAGKEAKFSEVGPTNSYALFVSKTTKGTGVKVDFKELAAKWKGMSAAQKEEFAKEAKKNAALKPKETVKKTKKSTTENSEKVKRAPSAYAKFVKENFAVVYADMKKRTDNPKEAFTQTTKALSEKYKAQK